MQATKSYREFESDALGQRPAERMVRRGNTEKYGARALLAFSRFVQDPEVPLTSSARLNARLQRTGPLQRGLRQIGS